MRKAKSFKTGPKDRAFGQYVNSACQKRGQELLKQARESYKKRAEYNKKECYQAAKEGATYLSAKVRGRVSVFGIGTYSCFECVNRFKKSCKSCYNGDHFVRKEVVHVTT